MALKDYREEFNNVFTDFENINISFDEITAKIPASRIEGDENQASERFFRSMNASVKEIKETIQNLRILMADDSKEKEAMEKFEILTNQVKFIRAEQNDFRTFLKKSEFEDLEIPGMREIYKIFTAAHKFMGVYTQMEQMKFVDKIDAANKEYDDAHQAYKDKKKEFAEKYKDLDIKNLKEDIEELTKAYDKKTDEKDKAHTILDNLKKQRNENEQRLGEYDFTGEGPTIDNDIDRWSGALKMHEDRNVGYKFYLDQIKYSISPILEPNKELQKKAEALDREVRSNHNERLDLVEDFNSSTEKLRGAYAENSALKPYITERMEQIDCQMLVMFLELYKRLNENTGIDRFPTAIEDMIRRRLGLKEDTHPTVNQVYEEAIKKLESLKPTAEPVNNPSLDAALSEYESRGRQLLTFEFQGHAKSTELQQIHQKIQQNVDKHKRELKKLQLDLRDKGVIKGDWDIERLEKADPYKVEEMLRYSKEQNDEAIKAYKTEINKLEEERVKKKNLRPKLNTRISAAVTSENTLQVEADQLKSKLNEKKAVLKDLKNLYELYKKKEAARAEAVNVYAKSKDKIDQQELSTMETSASDFYERVDDAAKGHKNSTEFEQMRIVLEQVTKLHGESRDVKTAKLLELKEKIETYQKAKAAQDRWRWIPTNLRKTRLAFADELSKWTDASLKLLEKGSAEHLKKMEEKFNKLSEIQTKKPKAKEMDAFTAAMDEKVKQPKETEKVNDNVNENVNVNEDDMELGASK